MKHYLSTMAAALLLSACGSDSSKKTDPTPAPYTVEVRYQGQNLAGMDAEVKASSVLSDGTMPENSFADKPTGSPALTVRPLGQVVKTREFSATITFFGITPGKTIPAGTFLSADVYVNGKLARTIRVDNTTTQTSFPSARTTIRNTDWNAF